MGQGNDGARAGLGNKHANTHDVPRFRALVMRKNPYVLLFLFLLLDHRIGLQVVAPGAVPWWCRLELSGRLEVEDGQLRAYVCVFTCLAQEDPACLI